jgi:hypothetical protein
LLRILTNALKHNFQNETKAKERKINQFPILLLQFIISHSQLQIENKGIGCGSSYHIYILQSLSFYWKSYMFFLMSLDLEPIDNF